MRRLSHPDMSFIKDMGLEDVKIVEMDLGDQYSISKLIRDIKPDEFYNLAAQSHVGTSFNQPEYTMDVSGSGVLRILEAIRLESPKTKLYQSSTSELFGESPAPQNELTPFKPQSPYAVAKLAAHENCRLYRNSYGLFAACAILFNMESPRRGELFLTKKVTNWIGQYVNGLTTEPLRVGTLDAKRDWGYCPDYVEAMYMIMQHDVADDFVIGTGETHTVREFIEEAFRAAGILGYWWKDGCFKTYDRPLDRTLVISDPTLHRPAEVPVLQADASKAKRVLGWSPKTNFKELVYIMVTADINKYKTHANSTN